MEAKILLEGCAVLYLLAAFIDLIFKRRLLRFCFELGALIIVVVIALLLNNSVNGTVSFGEGQSPSVVISVMFVAIVLGIIARYVFYVEPGKFSWLDLAKPVMISPIVLIPFIASVQTARNFDTVQLASFGLLAFQNGFFWQSVLSAARPVTPSRGGGHEN
jgi:hypothetical protein